MFLRLLIRSSKPCSAWRNISINQRLRNRFAILSICSASQVNGCAYCIDMHWKDLRAAGETEQRLYGLDAWEESPYYSERECAALAWTEAVTSVTEGHVSDEVYENVRKHLTEKELADLTLAVVAINGWNRLNVAVRTVPGGYQPRKRQELQKEA